MVRCNICGGATTPIQVKEQMIGFNEWFTYYQCTKCGHTHLEDIPEDIKKYYDPNDYYSFKNKDSFTGAGANSSTPLLKKIFGHSAAFKAFSSIKEINKNTLILDYGCGAGHFVKELKDLEYINARGFDPFLPENVFIDNELYLTDDLKLLKPKHWDVITLNHVFEHLKEPVQVLQELQQLLSTTGKLLLRFPVIDSYAFEKYRENWVQFDAPRHINLFTRKSIQLAVEQAGNYKIVKMYDDSFHFQFTGSELYLKKLSLNPNDNNRKKRLLSFKTYLYHFLAKKLNKQNRGDQLVIILQRI